MRYNESTKQKLPESSEKLNFWHIITSSVFFLAGQTGTMHLKFPQSVSSWHVKVTFTAPVSDFQVWVGGNIQCSGLSCEFDNMDWDGNIEAGQILDVPYLMYFSSASEINGIILLGVQLCGNNGDEYVIMILHIYKKLQSYIN